LSGAGAALVLSAAAVVPCAVAAVALLLAGQPAGSAQAMAQRAAAVLCMPVQLAAVGRHVAIAAAAFAGYNVASFVVLKALSPVGHALAGAGKRVVTVLAASMLGGGGSGGSGGVEGVGWAGVGAVVAGLALYGAPPLWAAGSGAARKAKDA
jgi:hypothetical protein